MVQHHDFFLFFFHIEQLITLQGSFALKKPGPNKRSRYRLAQAGPCESALQGCEYEDRAGIGWRKQTIARPQPQFKLHPPRRVASYPVGQAQVDVIQCKLR